MNFETQNTLDDPDSPWIGQLPVSPILKQFLRVSCTSNTYANPLAAKKRIDELGLSLSEADTLLWHGSNTAIFTRACSPRLPAFEDAAPLSCPHIGFMRSMVLRTYRASQIAYSNLHTPNMVAIHGSTTRHFRKAIGNKCDLSNWIAIAPSLLQELSEVCSSGVSDRQSSVRETLSPVSLVDFSRQQILFEKITTGMGLSDTQIEQEIIEIATSVIAGAIKFRCDQVRKKHLRASCELQRQKTVNKVAQYIATNVTSALCLEELARIGHCSVAQLTRTFPQLTGYTVHDYQIQLRLKKSLRMLGHENNTLAAVGRRLGFHSHSHFTMAFRCHMRMTPSDYLAERNLLERNSR